MVVIFISSKGSDGIRIMHTKSSNTEIKLANETDYIMKELFKSLLQKNYQGLEKAMRGTAFVFDSDYLFHYNLHKISLNRSRSYIDSSEWLKNKKVTINPNNNDNKCLH